MDLQLVSFIKIDNLYFRYIRLCFVDSEMDSIKFIVQKNNQIITEYYLPKTIIKDKGKFFDNCWNQNEFIFIYESLNLTYDVSDEFIINVFNNVFFLCKRLDVNNSNEFVIAYKCMDFLMIDNIDKYLTYDHEKLTKDMKHINEYIEFGKNCPHVLQNWIEYRDQLCFTDEGEITDSSYKHRDDYGSLLIFIGDKYMIDKFSDDLANLQDMMNDCLFGTDVVSFECIDPIFDFLLNKYCKLLDIELNKENPNINPFISNEYETVKIRFITNFANSRRYKKQFLSFLDNFIIRCPNLLLYDKDNMHDVIAYVLYNDADENYEIISKLLIVGANRINITFSIFVLIEKLFPDKIDDIIEIIKTNYLYFVKNYGDFL